MTDSIAKKLQILTEGAKYDASCASSGASVSRPGERGSKVRGGLCHSWSADGRCVSLLKILFTNTCTYDCAYCVNRRSNDIPRTAFTPQELATLTMHFYERNYIEGLFLSSAVMQSPDHTMEQLLETVRLLREERGFRGYIHLKLIPGASAALIERAGRLADRVSVNIELPTRQSLALLAPQKDADTILGPMQQVSAAITVSRAERRVCARAPVFSPAGQSTQLIVGATPESDLQIMRLSSWLYRSLRLKRVYYSAYVPVNRNATKPGLSAPPLAREHRLYQADWLIRRYGFSVSDLLDETAPQFDADIDPKIGWAFRHFAQFPVEVNTAPYEQLLRVPGIGICSAGRIVRFRRMKRLRPEDLAKLRVSLRRAQYFITVNGKSLAASADLATIRRRLTEPRVRRRGMPQQLTWFEHTDEVDTNAAITGEF